MAPTQWACSPASTLGRSNAIAVPPLHLPWTPNSTTRSRSTVPRVYASEDCFRAFPRTDIPVLFQRSRAPGAESPLSSAVRNVVPDVSPAVTTLGIATASESTRRHLNIVRIRRTSRSGSHIPCPVTQPISESSHLALERIDAFADGSVVRFG